MRFGPALVCLAAVLAALPAGAEIMVQDEGQQGIVLSNLAVRTAAAAAPGLAPARARPAAVGPSAHSAMLRRGHRFAPLVRAAAQAHGLPEALLQAVIEVESGYDAAAASPKGALGLMQLMPGTARALGVSDARDPAANIDGGARYLKGLLARYGDDLALALAAYNAGPGAVQRSGGMPSFRETQAYVPRVMARYHRLQSGAE